MAFHILRLVDEASRYHDRQVFNHAFPHDLDSLRLRDIVFNGTLEHDGAYVYEVDGNGGERCVAACDSHGLPCVMKEPR